MKNTNKIKTSWRDVTINEYFELRNKLKEEGLTNYEKEIIKIAFINNMNENDVWNLKISELKRMQANGSWIGSFKINEDVKFKNININDDSYDIDTDLHNFTIAQYIDFQTFFPKRKSDENYIGNLLACFIIPKKKMYGEGYDVQELVRKINENVDVLTANEIIFFFLKQYLISMKVMASFFNWQIKILKMIGKKKNKEKIEKIEKKWEDLQKNISTGLPSLIM